VGFCLKERGFLSGIGGVKLTGHKQTSGGECEKGENQGEGAGCHVISFLG
jgi:hypothetical protein